MSQDNNLAWYQLGKRNNPKETCCLDENSTKRIKNELNEEEFRDLIIYYCSKIIKEDAYFIEIKDVADNKKEIKVSLKKLDWFEELDKILQENIIYNFKRHIITKIKNIDLEND